MIEKVVNERSYSNATLIRSSSSIGAAALIARGSEHPRSLTRLALQFTSFLNLLTSVPWRL